MTDPGPYENPSADKFGPMPGPERFEAPKPRRALQWSALFVTLFLLIARLVLDQIHTTGATEYIVLASIAGMVVAEFIRDKRDRDRREEINQPDTHTITPR